jgi:hypothetical protein
MQNNNYIFEILSKFLYYIFEVNHFIFLIFFGYLVFRIISFLCKKFPFSKQGVKSCLNKIIRKNKNIDKGSKYFDYAPIDLIDEYKSQEESKNLNDDNSTPYAEQFKELKSFLENDNVKNLAVFGSYGAGKSSFIKTFFNHFTVNNRREDDEVIYISLSDFDYINVSKKKNQSNKQQSDSGNKTNLKLNKKSITIGKQSNYTKEDTLESNLDSKSETFEFDTCKLDLETVETEIIRQLVCSKISKKIPVSLFSNFKSDFLEKLKITFVIFCCITVFLLCLNQQVEREDFFSIDIDLLPKLSLLFLLIHSFIEYIFRRFRFSNISFFNVGVSAKDKSEESIFDSYLDEITYLFEESNCRYVVFEDLDRTDNYEVLTHLRNLNFILNNDYRCIDNITGKQRKIVFIYVIRIDIFNTALETVKFFDSSIHVQNVITSANSREFFIKYRNDLCKRFKNDNLKKEFLSTENVTDEFLSNIAFFVTDLRLVKMIFNDYLNILGSLDTVFSTLEISSIKLFAQKAFSYAVFRSVYPIECEELLKDEGIIFNYLNRKLSYYKKLDEPEYNLNLNTVEEEKESTLLEKQSQSGNFDKKKLTEYLSIRPLLKLLIDEKSECLAEDYRLYSALFPKDKFKSKANDVKFLSGILNSSNEYSPHLEISKYIAEVILQYFPNTVFDCNSIFNCQFFYSILTRVVLTNNNTYNKMLEKYTSLAVNKLAKAQYYYDKRNKTYSKRKPIEISDFFVGVCDFINPSSPNYNDLSSEKIRLWLITISNQFATLYFDPKVGDSILGNIKSVKFFAYLLNYCVILFHEEDKFEIYKIFNKDHIIEWIRKDLSYMNNSYDLQDFLAKNSEFVTYELFSSLAYLGFQFPLISSYFSVKNRNNYIFLMFLINRYTLDKDHNVIFYFEVRRSNFAQISKYLMELFCIKDIRNFNIKYYDQQTESDISSIPTETRFLTILLNVTDESIENFNTAFFRFLFVTDHYENLLNLINFPFHTEQQPYLDDSGEIIFFVTLMMCLSYVQNEAEKSDKKFVSMLAKSDHYLKSKLENYSEYSLFNNVLFCFLDAESQKINELEPVLKKTIAYNYMAQHIDLTKDNIFSKWMNIYPGFNFNNGLNLYKAFAKAFSLLLNYSCLENKNPAINSSITNIIYIRNILDRRLTDDYPRVYPDMSSINEYKLCWKSLSQFFHKYYKEIFASDKDKLYNLAPGFDKSPYSFEKTKQYISSLKKKDN